MTNFIENNLYLFSCKKKINLFKYTHYGLIYKYNNYTFIAELDYDGFVTELFVFNKIKNNNMYIFRLGNINDFAIDYLTNKYNKKRKKHNIFEKIFLFIKNGLLKFKPWHLYKMCYFNVLNDLKEIDNINGFETKTKKLNQILI
jgi:hypothetical protein